MTQILADPDEPRRRSGSPGSYGSHGVFRTDDNGATFRALGDVEHVDYMSIDFTDPDRSTILAGGHESSTVHRSKDGGATWDELPGLPADIGFTASPYVIDANTFLVGSYNGRRLRRLPLDRRRRVVGEGVRPARSSVRSSTPPASCACCDRTGKASSPAPTVA